MKKTRRFPTWPRRHQAEWTWSIFMKERRKKRNVKKGKTMNIIFSNNKSFKRITKKYH